MKLTRCLIRHILNKIHVSYIWKLKPKTNCVFNYVITARRFDHWQDQCRSCLNTITDQNTQDMTWLTATYLATALRMTLRTVETRGPNSVWKTRKYPALSICTRHSWHTCTHTCTYLNLVQVAEKEWIYTSRCLQWLYPQENVWTVSVSCEWYGQLSLSRLGYRMDGVSLLAKGRHICLFCAQSRPGSTDTAVP